MLKRLLTQTHSVPLFQGDQSRIHHDVPMRRLAFQGAVGAVRERRALADVQEFVQFVGFPRSGHSLIGSVLDAHPRAVVSHELDAMGLLRAGLSERMLYALVLENSAAFSRNGRYWNGFSYVVPGQDGGGAGRPTVVGDKKGDWAVRWVQQEPDLLDAVRRRLRARCRWVLVTRHPLDNIATMSLRKGRTYDRLRIASESSAAFKAELKAAQARGDIAASALDAMIDDYEELCGGVAQMEAAISPDDWLHVVYEQFTREPEVEIRRLCQFLDLDPEPEYLAAAASIVHDSPNKSRRSVTWTDAQLERVRALTRRFSFLVDYDASDDPSPPAPPGASAAAAPPTTAPPDGR
ncbi:hypothetical protein RQM47_08380 [Rubrivirga sp. S365]|uniref:Sulfotransferase family protein n=1 Tax=Rubrivirga litoralis TaxID=3075598 RepID=A0ABU3BPL1_9BACT|nr:MULTISPECIES: sulfotransferase [unclassified Rubrivirga]MDT0631203.1 hypothetical protein [Rubrivirga sp. F394]MDT7856654.1 hypothetical protein [Rubrivirga sp. S365]